VVSPHCDPRVIARTVERGMLSAPGIATPSEAFTALQAGAHALKLFPADMVGHGGLKAFKSVLPTDTDIWPVGGITHNNMAGWIAAGATGFGIGSQLYAPGNTAAQVLVKARLYIDSWTQAKT
jgi:2-dehydro-3-deoxyphosphogalactonate aldolase